MEYTPLPHIQRRDGAFTQIQPFTYRDGETYLNELTRLRCYVESLANFIDESQQGLYDNVLDDINTAIDSVNGALAGQTDYVDTEISTLVTFVNDSVEAIINSSVEVQDTVMAGILEDPNSMSAQYVNANFVPALVATGPGFDPTGTEDSTAAFRDILERATLEGKRVIIPAGFYRVDSITLGPHTHISGYGGDTTRFGSQGITEPRVFLIHTLESTEPLITVDGGGVTIEGIELRGVGNPYPLLYTYYGFELRMNAVRMYGCTGTAWVVRRANNTLIDGVMVDNCGSLEEPAVVIGSPFTAEGAGETNTFDARGLTIERSANVALSIAYGGPAHEGHYAEFVRLTDLHIEGVVDNDGQSNVDALVQIGNVRHVQLVNPLIYGGPGALIEHNQITDRETSLYGGITLIGGMLLGFGNFITPTLIHLIKGSDFNLIGTRCGRFGSEVIKAEQTYGAQIAVDPTVTVDGPRLITDERTSASLARWRYPGDAIVRGLTVGDEYTAAPTLNINSHDGSVRRITLASSDVARWFIQAIGPETGGNTGSNLEIVARNDDGGLISTAMTISRANRVTTFGGPVRAFPAPTANRPTPQSAGVGAMMYDTTINKPIWSNGTNWIDSAGTVVT